MNFFILFLVYILGGYLTYMFAYHRLEWNTSDLEDKLYTTSVFWPLIPLFILSWIAYKTIWPFIVIFHNFVSKVLKKDK